MVEGDIGKVLEVVITENGSPKSIADATVMQIIIVNAIGTTKTFTAVFSTDGTNGAIRYTTTAITDVDRGGMWKIQAYIERPSEKFHTVFGTFNVDHKIY